MLPPLLLALLAAAGGTLAQSSNATIPLMVSLPIQAPPTSSPLASTLLSFSIEQDRWPDWSGTSRANAFTHAALSRLAGLTGTPPKIRVGANTEDKTVWSPSVTVRAVVVCVRGGRGTEY